MTIIWLQTLLLIVMTYSRKHLTKKRRKLNERNVAKFSGAISNVLATKYNNLIVWLQVLH